MEPSAGHRPPDDTAPTGWASLQDTVEDAIDGLRTGEHLDLTAAESRGCTSWRIRISAGWPEVQGPGTHAYKLELGCDDGDGVLAPWSSSPAARHLGFGATATGCAVSDLALVTATDGDASAVNANPGLVTAGPAGIVELADLVVELLHDVFGVRRPALVRVSGVLDPGAVLDPDAGQEPGAAQDSPLPERWWRDLGFTEEPLCLGDTDHLVGQVGDVLVEVEHDRTAVPGLVLSVVRGRLTDPGDVPVTMPPGENLPRAGATVSRDGVELVSHPVRAAGTTWHQWLHHAMVTSEPTTSWAVHPPLLAAAVCAVAEAVRTVRLEEPRSRRPLRQVTRPL